MKRELLAKNIRTILEGICWHPEQSTFEGDTDDPASLRVTFQPAAPDLRCCIGESGRCIKGLQHVAAVIGRLNGYRASIHLKEDFAQHEREDHEFTQNPAIEIKPIADLASSLLSASFNRPVKLKMKRQNDLLRLETDTRSDGENVLLQALNEPLYAYGYRQGIIIKLTATQEKDPRKFRRSGRANCMEAGSGLDRGSNVHD